MDRYIAIINLAVHGTGYLPSLRILCGTWRAVIRSKTVSFHVEPSYCAAPRHTMVIVPNEAGVLEGRRGWMAWYPGRAMGLLARYCYMVM